MNGFKKFLTAAFMAAAMLVPSVATQAMEIQQYDKMAIPDQVAYESMLWKGAEQVLRDEGRPDLAEKVDNLYLTILPGDQHPIGVVEFERNLGLARVADAKNVLKDPHAQRLEVEHAMIVTLKKNGIILPQSFMHVADNFQPKLPPQEK